MKDDKDEMMGRAIANEGYNEQILYQKDWSMVCLYKGWNLATVYLLIIIIREDQGQAGQLIPV